MQAVDGAHARAGQELRQHGLDREAPHLPANAVVAHERPRCHIAILPRAVLVHDYFLVYQDVLDGDTRYRAIQELASHSAQPRAVDVRAMTMREVTLQLAHGGVQARRPRLPPEQRAAHQLTVRRTAGAQHAQIQRAQTRKYTIFPQRVW